MPLMIGRAPFRRTIPYLKSGHMEVRRDMVAMLINWNERQRASKGLYDFVFWDVPRIKYKNPDLQILTFRNFAPTPWILFINAQGKRLGVDCFGQSREHINHHLSKTFCYKWERSPFVPAAKRKTRLEFGEGRDRRCICLISGQVPCPGWTPLPLELRGKYIYGDKKKEEEEGE